MQENADFNRNSEYKKLIRNVQKKCNNSFGIIKPRLFNNNNV